MENQTDYRFIQIGLNIAYYRKIKKISQIRLAEMVNISRTHISRIERNASCGSIEVLFAIADALEIPITKLFEFRD